MVLLYKFTLGAPMEEFCFKGEDGNTYCDLNATVTFKVNKGFGGVFYSGTCDKVKNYFET